jgi:hypothetical protein
LDILKLQRTATITYFTAGKKGGEKTECRCAVPQISVYSIAINKYVYSINDSLLQTSKGANLIAPVIVLWAGKIRPERIKAYKMYLNVAFLRRLDGPD